MDYCPFIMDFQIHCPLKIRITAKPETKKKEPQEQQSQMALSFYHIYNLIVSIHTCTHFLDMIRSNVFIIFHHLVNDTIRRQFNDAVCYRFNKFMVM